MASLIRGGLARARLLGARGRAPRLRLHLFHATRPALLCSGRHDPPRPRGSRGAPRPRVSRSKQGGGCRGTFLGLPPRMTEQEEEEVGARRRRRAASMSTRRHLAPVLFCTLAI